MKSINTFLIAFIASFFVWMAILSLMGCDQPLVNNEIAPPPEIIEQPAGLPMEFIKIGDFTHLDIVFDYEEECQWVMSPYNYSVHSYRFDDNQDGIYDRAYIRARTYAWPHTPGIVREFFEAQVDPYDFSIIIHIDVVDPGYRVNY